MSELDVLRRVAPSGPPTPTARNLARAALADRMEAATRPRRAFLRLAVPAAGALAAAGIAAAVVFFGIGHGGQPAASAAGVLREAAAAARVQTSPALGPGDYLYVRSRNTWLGTALEAGGVTFSFLTPGTREFWQGPGGGLLRASSGPARFLSERDRAAWIEARRPALGNSHGEVELPAWRPLELPTDPDALYAQLAANADGKGSGLHAQMFDDVASALRETATTPKQRAALYEVAALIPGVELVGEVTDRAGRPGVAVAPDDHVNHIRYTFTFDQATGALLEEEQRVLVGNLFGYPDGTLIGYSTYLVTEVVHGLGERP